MYLVITIITYTKNMIVKNVSLAFSQLINFSHLFQIFKEECFQLQLQLWFQQQLQRCYQKRLQWYQKGPQWYQKGPQWYQTLQSDHRQVTQ